jgi:hypothetical protein
MSVDSGIIISGETWYIYDFADFHCLRNVSADIISSVGKLSVLGLSKT